MARVVAVTGAARTLGGRLAQALATHPEVTEVIGVDVIPPTEKLEGVRFIRTDIRSPAIAKVLLDSGVDTVAHMGVIATRRQAGGRVAMKEINVIGTMQLLAACQQTPSVTRLVVKSSASIYGCGPKDPAIFTEGMDPRHPPTSGWAKDCAEVEAYVRGFRRRRPEVCVTILRPANVIGPRIRTAMTEYFRMPVIPTLLGHDGRLQFLHEDDAIALASEAATRDLPGTFNLAGSGVLTLMQAVRRTRHQWLAVPSPMLTAVGKRLPGGDQADFSREQVRLLTYGRVLDTDRALQSFEYAPRYSTEEAFADFLASQ
ncbi:MAG: NAD-dependent epimerase/dehydratase family protein [Actinomycetales bacterium]|nr:NAD-dependent epimerase/dehydratase family protein [Actinomycetales bacterium]